MAKVCSTINQSKKLIKLGIDKDTSDMYYEPDPLEGYRPIPRIGRYSSRHNQFPAWSLSALLEVLPKIHKLKPLLDLEENSIMYSGTDIYIFASNPVDACYETILKLHELNLL